jgi:hypothetical protein
MGFSPPVAARVLGAAQDQVHVRPQNASPSPTYLNLTQASGVEGALGVGSRKEVREEGERSGVGMERERARVKANPGLVWRTIVMRATTTTMNSRRDGGQDCCWAPGKYAVCPLADKKTASRRVWQGGLAAAGASVVEWRTGPFSQRPWISFTCIFYIEGELDLDFFPLYQSSTNRTALRSSWECIYVRTWCLISAVYEIISDLKVFFWPLGGDGMPCLEDDQVLFQYRDLK